MNPFAQTCHVALSKRVADEKRTRTMATCEQKTKLTDLCKPREDAQGPVLPGNTMEQAPQLGRDF